MDLMAAISDPVSWPLLATLLLAASMYPVGILLPCSACCQGCTGECTDGGSLPTDFTLEFSGFPDVLQPEYFIFATPLSCTGSGARARALGPGGTLLPGQEPAVLAGPLGAWEVTEGGENYAVPAREEPTGVGAGVSFHDGTDAEFVVTLTQTTDGCGLTVWTVSGIAITDGGDGYAGQVTLEFSGDPGTIFDPYPLVFARTLREAPPLTAAVQGTGNGALVALSTQQVAGTSPPVWEISGAAITDGGTGYEDWTPIAVGYADDVVAETPASLFGRIEKLEPQPVHTESASVTFTIAPDPYYPEDGFTITAASIDQPGSGYSVGQYINVEVPDGVIVQAPYISVTSVDASGGITGLAIEWGGLLYRSTGAIVAVSPIPDGRYYRDTGTLSDIEILDGGQLYAEAPEGAEVPEITFSIAQLHPQQGQGATLTAEVDTDRQSPTFGQITGVTTAAAGDGYLAWLMRRRECCSAFWNGRSVVVSGTPDQPVSGECVYRATTATVGAGSGDSCGSVGLTVPGVGGKLRVTISPAESGICAREWESDFLFDGTCNAIDWTLTLEDGSTVRVTPGGNPAPPPPDRSCFLCCQGAAALPLEITASFVGEDYPHEPIDQFDTNPFPEMWTWYDGDYVFQLGLPACPDACVASWHALLPPGPPNYPVNEKPLLRGLELTLTSCSRQTFNSFLPWTEFNYETQQAGDECDFCSEKCFTEAWLEHWEPLGGFGGGTVLYRTGSRIGATITPENIFGGTADGKAQWLSCQQACLDNPQCRPAPGAYQLRNWKISPNFGPGTLYVSQNTHIGTLTVL